MRDRKKINRGGCFSRSAWQANCLTLLDHTRFSTSRFIDASAPNRGKRPLWQFSECIPEPTASLIWKTRILLTILYCENRKPQSILYLLSSRPAHLSIGIPRRDGNTSF